MDEVNADAVVPEIDWKARAEVAERELAVRAAMVGVDWLDESDARRELEAGAKIGDGGAWVVESGVELAKRKPHWVKAKFAGGTGAGGGAAGGGGVTLDELLRPENAGKLRALIHERPAEYQRLWEMKFGK